MLLTPSMAYTHLFGFSGTFWTTLRMLNVGKAICMNLVFR